jgi:hypothetical protein
MTAQICRGTTRPAPGAPRLGTLPGEAAGPLHDHDYPASTRPCWRRSRDPSQREEEVRRQGPSRPPDRRPRQGQLRGAPRPR